MTRIRQRTGPWPRREDNDSQLHAESFSAFSTKPPPRRSAHNADDGQRARVNLYLPHPPVMPAPPHAVQRQASAGSSASTVAGAGYYSVSGAATPLVISRTSSLISDGTALSDMPDVHRFASTGELGRLTELIYSTRSLGSREALVNEATSSRKVLPIHFAAQSGNIEVQQFLSSVGSDIEAVDKHGATPLYYACKKTGNASMVQHLLQCQAKVNVHEERLGWTPLHVAASAGDPKIVSLLLQYGADPRLCSRSASLPLHHAAEKNRLAVVKMLVNAMTTTTTTTPMTTPPLHYQNVQERHHVSIDVQNTSGATPLMLAAKRGHTDVVAFLLSRGAGMPFVNNGGLSAFGRNRHARVVAKLLSFTTGKIYLRSTAPLESYYTGLEAAVEVAIEYKRLAVTQLILRAHPWLVASLPELESRLVAAFGHNSDEIMADRSRSSNIHGVAAAAAPVFAAGVVVVGVCRWLRWKYCYI